VLPSMNALVATTVTGARKSSALGTIFSFFHCGNLVGLALSPFIIASFGWPALFIIFGALGAPLLAAWYSVMPTHGARTKSVAASSLGDPASRTAQSDSATTSPREAIAAPADSTEARSSAGSAHSEALAASSADPTSVGAFLQHRATWAIVIANFVNHWGYFIFLSWIPAYFAKVFQLDLKASALMAFAPWIAMAVGSSFAGVLADKLVQRFHVRCQVHAHRLYYINSRPRKLHKCVTRRRKVTFEVDLRFRSAQ
jgi:predicted MFS family arabinose efflux permease